jgi:hypothetical protein
MKYKKVKLCTLLLGLGLTGMKAQNAATAAGGDAAGSGGSLSYSIGQSTYTTVSGTTGTVAQGVQQPYEISVVTSLESAQNIDLGLSTYPNPTTSFLNLKVGNSALARLSYQLLDVNGKTILTGQVTGTETRIVTEHLSDAVYFLKVADNNNEIKTFKIIKN